MKKAISVFLSFVTAASVFAFSASAGRAGDADGDREINNRDIVTLFRYVSGIKTDAAADNCDFNGDGKINNKDVTLLFRAVSDGTVPEIEDYTPDNPYAEGWDETIVKANELADGVQGRFTDASRSGFLIQNKNMSVCYDLTTFGQKQVKAIYNADGRPYFENTCGAYITDTDGTVYHSAYSPVNARMNSNRLGYYYYDFHFRDQGFSDPSTDNAEDVFDVIKASSGWGGNMVKNVSKKNGVVSYDVTNSFDPYVLPAKVGFSADKYNAVQITIRTEYATSGNIYIIAGGRTQFSDEQRADFNCTAGQDTTVFVPLSNLPDYNGSVVGIRIDCGYKAGEKIQIKEITAVNRGKNSVPFAYEHTFHTYSDKMHEMFRIVATDEYKTGDRFETKTVIPADTVRKTELKNASGIYSSLDGFDFSTTEYVAFDIRGAGVYGIIMPDVYNNGYISVELTGGKYVITRGIYLNSYISKGEEIFFGHRIYASTSRHFDGIRKEAYIERNPLTGSVSSYADGAIYNYYDALIGCYIFSVTAIEFDTAYYYAPDKQFRIKGVISGDGEYDRTIYVQTAENMRTKRGRLECAALLDENGRLLPVPLEVCKNFDGENEEPVYAFEPGTAAAAYGEAYIPLTVGKNETKNFTVLHLYQNWGNFPLKQLSSVGFHTPYYHLSVGVTETNCIVPYYVYGKDGWVLPDFRSNSAPFWTNYGERGTQHTAVGRLYFLQYKDASGKSYKSESQSADIVSSGPVYADLRTEYLSDDGKIKASYRHTEMAQTDENRTYYKIRLEVLDDIKIKDFKNDFSFFSFDSRSVAFSKVGYLDENGVQVVETVQNGTDRTVKLGKEYPYFEYYGADVEDSVNFALMIRDFDMTLDGKKYGGSFIFKDRCDGSQNYASLSLDLGAVTLKKGDVLELELILLPWGYGTSTDDENVRKVRKDSCTDPFRITVLQGEPYEDCFIPSVRAKDGVAQFRISGGASVAAVRVYGFTDYIKPDITFMADGRNTAITLEGPNGNDGYQVYLDEDGTYSFSFNVDMDAAGEYEISILQ